MSRLGMLTYIHVTRQVDLPDGEFMWYMASNHHRNLNAVTEKSFHCQVKHEKYIYHTWDLCVYIYMVKMRSAGWQVTSRGNLLTGRGVDSVTPVSPWFIMAFHNISGQTMPAKGHDQQGSLNTWMAFEMNTTEINMTSGKLHMQFSCIDFTDFVW